MPDRNVRMPNPTHRYENVSGPTGHLDILWSKQLEGVFSIAVWNRSVYVGTNSYQIVAFEVESGSSKWSLETRSMIGGPSPTVSGGVVYSCASDISEDDGGVIYSVDADTGTIKWQSEVAKSVNTKPIIVDRTVYVGGPEGRLYALDTNNGSTKWEFNIGEDSLGHNWVNTPAVIDGTVYVGTDNGLYALDSNTGTSKWQYQVDNGVRSPTVVDGTVYVASGNTLSALEANKGAPRWQSELADYITGAAVVEDTVYVGSENGIHAVDAATGTVKWHSQTGSKMRTAPVVFNDTLYIGSSDGTIYGLNVTSGNIQWQHSFNQNTTIHTVVVNENLFVGTNDALYVFGTTKSSDTELYGQQTVENEQVCPACDSNLSEYGDPNFCPECGTDISSTESNTRVYNHTESSLDNC